MAFRKKAGAILLLKPDILIVPECECPGKLKFPFGAPVPKDILWFGENPNKGLGIFSYSAYKLRLLDTYDPAIQMIIPIAVTGRDFDFTLYAIWANNPHDPDGQYVEQVWKAINHYDNYMSDKRTILAGDFNSNTIWDRKNRKSNHSNVVRRLEEKGIFSSYHSYFNSPQGKEKHPTLYMYRHKNKPYHIDYCFVSADMAKKIKSVEVGAFIEWTKYSDHVPLVVTFKKTGWCP